MKKIITQQEAIKLISKNHLNDLFDKLIYQMDIFNKNTNYLEDDESLRNIYNNLILLSSRTAKLEQDVLRGIINIESQTMTHNQVILGSINITNQLPITFWEFWKLDDSISEEKLSLQIKEVIVKDDDKNNAGEKIDKKLQLNDLTDSPKLIKRTMDRSVFSFMGIPYNKGRLVNSVVKEYVRLNPNLTYDDLEKVFPKETQGSFGVFATIEKAQEIYARENEQHKRFYFVKPYDLIELKGSIITTCNQWNTKNIAKFIKTAKNINPDFKIEKM